MGYDGVPGGKDFGNRHIQGERILKSGKAMDIVVRINLFPYLKRHS